MALKKVKDENNYWISYSDLMTGFLIVFIILTFVVYKNYKHKTKEIEVLLNEYKKIEEIKSALLNLNTTYFTYDSINKRHELKISIEFSGGSHDIPEIYKVELIKAGKELERVINNVIGKDLNIRYMVIIEGMAARYGSSSETWKNSDPDRIKRTYILSYHRARLLYKLWKENGIKINRANTEVILAGSGWFGAGRYTGALEGKNKRVLIQIIPKVGIISNDSIK
jgi:hypothetical protein